MKKVLVFGGSGFLGYYLTKELLLRGYQVSVSDIAEPVELVDRVNFIQCNISDRENIDRVFESDRFEIVFNLAGFANLDEAIKNPIKTIELNVLSNMYIIEACLKSQVSKFVYASSAYAVSNKGSFYGISKLASEKIIEEYHKKHNLNFTILRYGSVYSERAHDNNYIFNLIKEAIKTRKIEHAGDGKEIREYIHAADAATLSVNTIESTEFNNIHVILTGTERMARVELFNMINEMLNYKIEINCNASDYNNHYKFTPYSFEPTISKKLIANPHIDMGQGLLECIKAISKYED
jgi:UDP-glucose 4-epimerase